MKSVYLLLGSNMGDREENLALAVFEISLNIGPVTGTSSVYETHAWGFTEQNSFYNQAVKVQTKLSPEEVLKTAQEIEEALGRIRDEKWGPRTIDIDIIYYEKKIIKQENLIVPHRLLQERRFVLTPLAEISPNFIHPILLKSNKSLLSECPDKSQVDKLPLFLFRQDKNTSDDTPSEQ